MQIEEFVRIPGTDNGHISFVHPVGILIRASTLSKKASFNKLHFLSLSFIENRYPNNFTFRLRRKQSDGKAYSALDA
jgi:hypothetical protein